jgi:general secretion pathway protein H
VVWLPISSPRRGSASRQRAARDAGFSLLEVVCTLAILAMLAAIAAPRLPRNTSRAHLEGYAVKIAALLKADRYAAMRRRESIATEVNASARIVRSGATGQFVEIPSDVILDSHLAARCQNHQRESSVRFLASGMSCGGVIVLRRSEFGYEVRVNWLTGGVEIGAITIS